MLPVLQLNAVVFSRHSDAGEPGEEMKTGEMIPDQWEEFDKHKLFESRLKKNSLPCVS